MSKWPGLITCSCGTQQACTIDSICNAKKMCCRCIAKACFSHGPDPPWTKNPKLDWNSKISAVLVHYLTSGKDVRGI